MNVVLDTDVLVAAVRSRRGAGRAWLRAVLGREATLLLSVPLALQYEAVLTREEHLEASGARLDQMLRLVTRSVPYAPRSRSLSCGARCCAIPMMRWCSRQRCTEARISYCLSTSATLLVPSVSA